MSASESGFGFAVTARASDCAARRGRLLTPHGALETPAFSLCATKGAVKCMSVDDLLACGVQVVLGNTYHLMLRPGHELVAELGGLHRFMGWAGPMFTDSGGYQVFSLGHGAVADEIKGRETPQRDRTFLEIDERGATFRSYVDGAVQRLTPELSMRIQRDLGADLVLQLDECTPFHADRAYTRASMERSMRWGDRCLEEFRSHDDGRQALYGIVQGGVHTDLRRTSVEYVSERGFFGHAIGGSLGGTKDQMYDVVGRSLDGLRSDRPVHLLGIGDQEDVWACVAAGVDSFDCVAPTRVARHGWALSRDEPGGRINLKNARFRRDDRPLREGCSCATCRRYSRAYVHHLFRAGERLADQLVSICNVTFMTELFATVRRAIEEDRFEAARRDWSRGA